MMIIPPRQAVLSATARSSQVHQLSILCQRERRGMNRFWDVSFPVLNREMVAPMSVILVKNKGMKPVHNLTELIASQLTLRAYTLAVMLGGGSYLFI